MFQNKPVIFYSFGSNDPLLSKKDKYIAQNLPKKMIFGNLFDNLAAVIKKVKYYVGNNFTLENELKKKYESLFFCKRNIFENLEKVFNNIMNEK